MEQLVVRNLPVGTKSALRARARSRGRSVESEVRENIADAIEERPHGRRPQNVRHFAPLDVDVVNPWAADV